MPALRLSILLLVAIPLPTHAAPLQFTSINHRDDAGTHNPATDQTQESPTFGTTTATLPFASSASTLSATDDLLSFTATQSRADATYAWAHTFFSVTFTPAADTPFTLTGQYAIHRAPSPTNPTVINLSAEFDDTTAHQTLAQYAFYDHVTADTILPLPTLSTDTLHAGHTYTLWLEAFNESDAGPPGGTSAVADLTLALPSPALTPAVAFALLALPLRRPRRARI